MKTRYILFFLFLLKAGFSFAQELYPNTEAASSIPKGIPGIKLGIETYQELQILRHQYYIRLLYGVTSRLSVYVETSASNHHNDILPTNLVNHFHIGTSTIYFANNKNFGIDYPYRWGGVYFYSKYRFVSIDREKSHFRMALYANASTTIAAHDEAEPSLDGDNKGYGGGLIATQLMHRLAITFTGGYIHPLPYHEIRYDYIFSNPIFKTDLTYGDAYIYDLAFGYLLYPKEYTGYGQQNYNIYLELLGKSFGGAKIVKDDYPVEAETATLKKDHYIDACVGIQTIFNSNTRLDLTASFNIINKSWSHFYPLFRIGIQHYFFHGK